VITIPSIGNHIFPTVNPTGSLNADGKQPSGPPPVDPDLYLRPAPNAGFNYLRSAPNAGDLYKRPGSP